MVIVLLADGFEELEALTPVDVMRRSNIDVRTVSVKNEKRVTGAHGISVEADMLCDEVDTEKTSLLVLPGGMPGVTNLDVSPSVHRMIDAALEADIRIAAICAAPSILGRRGILQGRRATCFPGFEGELTGAILASEPVVTDGRITTARDYECATEFAKELIRLLEA